MHLVANSVQARALVNIYYSVLSHHSHMEITFWALGHLTGIIAEGQSLGSRQGSGGGTV